MHWGRKYRYQSFLKNGGGITLVLGAAFAALESDGSVDGSDETDGELDKYLNNPTTGDSAVTAQDFSAAVD